MVGYLALCLASLLPFVGSANNCLHEADSEVIFLPQKPYLTSGSLADQVVYLTHVLHSQVVSLDMDLYFLDMGKFLARLPSPRLPTTKEAICLMAAQVFLLPPCSAIV